MNASDSTSNRWSTVARLFAEALERPSHEQQVFLRNACGSDAALRRDVQSLLAADGDAARFFADLENDVFDRPAPVSVMPAPVDVDEHVGPYRILGRLGQGGMGVVYKAHDDRLDRPVALKIMRTTADDSAEARARFLREARAAAALQHPNACLVHDVGETPSGALFIAMAYYDGDPLTARLHRGAVSPEAAWGTALQIARALAVVHDAGLVHRDVKPANVILTGSPLEEETVKLVDFGLAKDSRLLLTRPGSVVGTIPYMSPEQMRGEPVDARTDVWSLGACLYEMLAGRRPFNGDTTAAVVHAVQSETPSPLDTLAPDAPPALRNVAERCLTKDPAGRYPDGAALRSALLQARPASLSSGLDPKAPPPATLHFTELPRTGSVAPSSPASAADPSPASSEAPSALVVPDASRRWPVGSLFSTVLLAGLLAVLAFGADGPSRDSSVGSLVAGPTALHVAVSARAAAKASDPSAAFLAAGLAPAVSARLRAALPEGASVRALPSAPTAPLRAAAVRDGATRWLNLELTPAPTGMTVTLQLHALPPEREHRTMTHTASRLERASLPDTLAALAASLLNLDPARAHAPAPPVRSPAVRSPAVRSPAVPFCLEGRGRLRQHALPGTVDAALALFRQARAVDAEAACAYAGLGEAYWRRYTATHNPAWIDSTVAVTEQALVQGTNAPALHLTLGLIDAEKGRPGAAIAHFREALAGDPTLAAARAGLARALERAGRRAEAESTYTAAIQREPAYWGGYNDLGIHYVRHGRYADAATQFDRVVALAPHNAVGHRNRGAAAFLQENLDDAVSAYRRALDLAPDYAAYTNLGTALTARGHYAEAVSAFRNALDLQGSDHRVWGSLAEVLHATGRPTAARAALDTAVVRAERQARLNPHDPLLRTYLAAYEARRNRPRRARALLQQVLANPPESVDGRFRVGAVLALLGETDRALSWFERAVNGGYRIQDRVRYPRLAFLWDHPEFAALARASRSEPPAPAASNTPSHAGSEASS